MISKTTIIFGCVFLFLINLPSIVAQQKRGVEIVRIDKQGKGETIKLYEGSYALIIGESDFTGGWQNLPGVKSDISAVETALIKQGFQVKVLTNLKRDELINAIDSFVNEYGKTDYDNQLLIYFAGHGATLKALDGRGEIGYIVPSDAPLPSIDERNFRVKAVSMDDIRSYANSIQAKHTLFVFDSCFSGKLVTRADVEITPFIVENVIHPVKQFITSGSANETVSDGGDFRNFFIRAINGEADEDKDGFVLGSELAKFLMREMGSFFQKNPDKKKQTAQFGQYTADSSQAQGDFIFVVGGQSKKNVVKQSIPTAFVSDSHRAENKTNSNGSNQTEGTPKLDVVTAQSILDRAIKAKTGSLQGQVQAIETLIADGYDFSGSDLTGVSFKGANISRGKFNTAKLHAVDFSEANAQETDLTNTGLRFANLEKADLRKAILKNSFSPFVRGSQANFEGADLSGANFFSGDLRGANFKNAKLRGTSLAFADLRGAKFDGADLTGAYLIGAVLDGKTTFTNAVIENTDFIGTVADKFNLSEKQVKGSCRRNELFLKNPAGYLDWNVNLLEEWESDKYSTGYEYEKIVQDSWIFTNFANETLPVCTTPNDSANGFDARFPAELRLHLNREIASKANRRFLFKQQIENHRKLLTEMFTANNILKK